MKANGVMDRAIEIVQRSQGEIPEALREVPRDGAGHAAVTAALRIERAGGVKHARAAVVRMLCEWLAGEDPAPASPVPGAA